MKAKGSLGFRWPSDGLLFVIPLSSVSNAWVLQGKMAVPLLSKKIVKKRVKKFKRPQTDRKIAVKVWISFSIVYDYGCIGDNIIWAADLHGDSI